MVKTKAAVVLVNGKHIEITVAQISAKSSVGYRVTKVMCLDTPEGDEIPVDDALRSDLIYRAAVDLVEQMRLEDMIPNVTLKEVH